MRDCGIPEDKIAATIAQQQDLKDADFEVEPENWETVMIFQMAPWIKGYAGMEGVLWYDRLDYTNLEAMLRMMGFTQSKVQELFPALQLMEFTALPILNKKR